MDEHAMGRMEVMGARLAELESRLAELEGKATTDDAMAEEQAYVITPVSVIRRPGLSDRAFRMFTNLDARITSTGGQAIRIRIRILADDLGISPRKAHYALAELREAGLACPIHDPHRGHASVWTIANEAREA